MTLNFLPLQISENKEFENRMQDMDPFVCPLEELEAAMSDAPGQYELGFLAGVHALRVQLEIITGRSR